MQMASRYVYARPTMNMDAPDFDESPEIKEEALTTSNVILVSFSHLEERVNEVLQDPLKCNECGAVCNFSSKIDNDPSSKEFDIPEDMDIELDELQNSLGVWVCEFCGCPNPISKRFQLTIPTEEMNEFVLSERDEEDEVQQVEDMIVYVVDVSGSMSVSKNIGTEMDLSQIVTNTQYEPTHTSWISRLNAVKLAIISHINMLMKNSPDTKVVIVSFSNKVTVYTPDGNIVEIPTSKYNDMEELISAAQEIPISGSVQQYHQSIIDQVKRLKEGGQTALGPGVCVGVGIASKVPGARVILCTDGMANKGIGKQAGKERDKEFGVNIGTRARDLSVMVDVLTIEGTKTKLIDIGKMADISGGNIDIVAPESISERFAEALGNPILGTNTELTLILHESLYVLEEERRIGSMLHKLIGNATKNMQISLNYGIKEDLNAADLPENLPFQLQFQYTHRDGRVILRTITKTLSTTNEVEKVKEDLDIRMIRHNVTQRVARARIGGGSGKEIVQAQNELLGAIHEEDEDELNEYGSLVGRMMARSHTLDSDSDLSDEGAEGFWDAAHALY